MNIIDFYWELFKDNYYKLFTFDMLKDVYLPVANIAAVIYIFRKGEKGRKEDQISNFKFQKKLAYENNRINILNNKPSFHIDRMEFDMTFPLEYDRLSKLTWFNTTDDLTTKEFVALMKNKRVELKVRNVGKSNARNVVTTVDNINSIGYFKDNKNENNKFIMNDDEEYSIFGDEIVVTKADESSYRKELNGDEVQSIHRNRVIPSNATQIIPLDFSDILVFNHYIFGSHNKDYIPYLKLHIQYYDDFNDGKTLPYNEYIYLAVTRFVVREIYGKNIYDIHIRFEEITNERIKLTEEHTDIKYYN
ncbi:hypothetical protein [Macrococcus equi]|uniref:hypothetical protein n=1 Tax=Macrococcus equi TaxID=3395462 RepID=UPI0039BEC818